MMRPFDKKLSLKVKKCLIDQALKEYSGLEEVICQKPMGKTRSNVNRPNFFRVKCRFQLIIRLKAIKSQTNFFCYLSFLY